MKSFSTLLKEAIDITDNPNFWKWFGNSKVVDASGNPLVVYHGTTKRFTLFDTTGTEDEPGAFFTSSDDVAKEYYGDESISVFLHIENMYETTSGEIESGNDVICEIKSNGYDGVMIEGQDDADTFVVFSSTQIKSATGNNGDFDPNDPDITH